MKSSLALEVLRENANEVAARLRALANRERLLMLCRLSSGEASVGELVAVTRLSQSSVSQHLALLRQAGVVGVRAEQQNRFYSISDAQTQRIMDALCAACLPDDTNGAA